MNPTLSEKTSFGNFGESQPICFTKSLNNFKNLTCSNEKYVLGDIRFSGITSNKNEIDKNHGFCGNSSLIETSEKGAIEYCSSFLLKEKLHE
jgi:hypothetical protein